MLTKINRKKARIKRKARIRARLSGDAKRPRILIHKSNTALYSQVIDDVKSVVLASVYVKGTNIKSSEDLAGKILLLINKIGIKKAVFDRSGYKYHGSVKNFAEKIREGGIEI